MTTVAGHSLGDETKFRKRNQIKCPQEVSSKEACTAVVLSCQGKGLKVVKETGKGYGQKRERKDAHVRQGAFLKPIVTS
jgi:hypothetical protein